MGKRKDFIQLDFFNIEKCYKDGRLDKGSLVKWRHCIDTLYTFGLPLGENEWQYGIIATVHWHIVRPVYTIGTYEPERVCYDITVYNLAVPEARELISLDSSEIFLLADE